jgi:hypothetical protein
MRDHLRGAIFSEAARRTHRYAVLWLIFVDEYLIDIERAQFAKESFNPLGNVGTGIS